LKYLRLTRPRTAALIVPAMLAVAFFSSLPLAKNAPDPKSMDMVDIRRVWTWLQGSHQSDWGRVYVQDTFQLTPGANGLGASHVLALTSRETGVRQLGATYGVAPYTTTLWTGSEFSTLFGKFLRKPDDIQYVVNNAWYANVTHILTSDPRTAGLLKGSGKFDLLYSSGRFDVLRWRQYNSSWVNGSQDGRLFEGTHFATGRVSIPLNGLADSAGFLVKASYHPAWRLINNSRAILAPHPSGLIMATDIQPGQSTLDLEFKPSYWPNLISLLAILGIAAMAVATVNRSD